MKHLSLDAHDDSVKQFILSLSANPDSSILELNGQAVVHVFPVTAPTNGADEEWTEAKNARRCALIDQEIAGSLSPAEAEELARLQREMLRHRRRVAPLPLEDARRLHQQGLARREAVLRALTRVMRREFIATWLERPNPAAGGKSPLSLLEEGDYACIEEMIYRLEAGEPF